MTIKVNEVPGKKVTNHAALVCFTFMYLKEKFQRNEKETIFSSVVDIQVFITNNEKKIVFEDSWPGV